MIVGDGGMGWGLFSSGLPGKQIPNQPHVMFSNGGMICSWGYHKLAKYFSNTC
jgi:hypothetical protein